MEKKNSKMSIIIMLLIIILLIAGILAVTYLLNQNKNELNNKESEIAKLNENVVTLEKEVEELKNKNKNENSNKKENKEKDNESDIEDISKVEELLENKEEYAYLKVISLEEDDKQYLVSAEYYVPMKITEDEYSDMEKEKSISIKNKEYIFEEDNDDITGYGYGYIYEKDEEKDMGYSVYKTDEGYIFLRDVGGVQTTIDEKEQEIKFYLEPDANVVEVTIFEEQTIEEYLDSDKENYDVSNYKMTVVYNDNEISLEADKR